MNVFLVGHGNVAWHFDRALRHAGHNVEKVSAISLVAGMSATLGDVEDYTRSFSRYDFGIVAVGDRWLPDVVHAMRDFPYVGGVESKARILMHTSGSIGMDVYDDISRDKQACGVLYPLQTLTKGVETDFRRIPLLVEAGSEETLHRVSELARSISDTVAGADSEKRRRLHLGAVIACNFSNHMLTLADEYLKGEGLDVRLMQPLMEETLRKAMEIGPFRAQTGPAVRGDESIMQKHLEMLGDDPGLAEIYCMMSRSIMSRHKSE